MLGLFDTFRDGLGEGYLHGAATDTCATSLDKILLSEVPFTLVNIEGRTPGEVWSERRISSREDLVMSPPKPVKLASLL